MDFAIAKVSKGKKQDRVTIPKKLKAEFVKVIKLPEVEDAFKE